MPVGVAMREMLMMESTLWTLKRKNPDLRSFMEAEGGIDKPLDP